MNVLQATLAGLALVERYLTHAGADVIACHHQPEHHQPLPLDIPERDQRAEQTEAAVMALVSMVTARKALDRTIAQQVIAARELFVSWEQIGKCLNMSKQGAQQHYGS